MRDRRHGHLGVTRTPIEEAMTYALPGSGCCKMLDRLRGGDLEYTGRDGQAKRLKRGRGSAPPLGSPQAQGYMRELQDFHRPGEPCVSVLASSLTTVVHSYSLFGPYY